MPSQGRASQGRGPSLRMGLIMKACSKKQQETFHCILDIICRNPHPGAPRERAVGFACARFQNCGNQRKQWRAPGSSQACRAGARMGARFTPTAVVDCGGLSKRCEMLLYHLLARATLVFFPRILGKYDQKESAEQGSQNAVCGLLQALRMLPFQLESLGYILSAIVVLFVSRVPHATKLIEIVTRAPLEFFSTVACRLRGPPDGMRRVRPPTSHVGHNDAFIVRPKIGGNLGTLTRPSGLGNPSRRSGGIAPARKQLARWSVSFPESSFRDGQSPSPPQAATRVTGGSREEGRARWGCRGAR
jgi:hypothetical protein